MRLAKPRMRTTETDNCAPDVAMRQGNDQVLTTDSGNDGKCGNDSVQATVYDVLYVHSDHLLLLPLSWSVTRSYRLIKVELASATAVVFFHLDLWHPLLRVVVYVQSF